MITLITGTPGAGKTLRAVYLITQAVEKGRLVFTDIDGISLDGVESVGPDHDWRDTPEGSLVVYDEVQRRWPSTGKPGQAPDEDIRALETHRHTGHDIIVITQHPTLVHHHVRKLVGEHIHVRRLSSANVVTLFTLPEVFDPKDKKELRNTDKQTFKYPKKLFSAYKSSTTHTHKFKIPAKFKALAVFLVLLIALIGYLISTLEFFSSDQPAEPPSGKGEAAAAAARPLPMAHPDYVPPPGSSSQPALVAAATAHELPTISGCLSVGDRCRCWADSGKPLDTSLEQCQLLLAEMPRALFSGGGGRGASPGRGDAPASLLPTSEGSGDYQVAGPPPPDWESNGAYSPSY